MHIDDHDWDGLVSHEPQPIRLVELSFKGNRELTRLLVHDGVEVASGQIRLPIDRLFLRPRQVHIYSEGLVCEAELAKVIGSLRERLLKLSPYDVLDVVLNVAKGCLVPVCLYRFDAFSEL